MKKVLIPITLLITLSLNSQPRKAVLDSVTLRNNILINYSGGIGTQRGGVISSPGGAQVMRYDGFPYGSYYSSGTHHSGHPGTFNIAIGDGVLDSATEGQANYNIFLGQKAGWNNRTGWNNIALGWEAFKLNATGSDNVAISEDALFNNTNGYGNNAIGRGAMYKNTSGLLNTAVGYNALQANITGEENTTLGAYSGAWLINGDRNTFIGTYAGESNGSDNVTINESVAIGYSAGINPIGSRAICIGANTQAPGNDEINIGNFIYRIGNDLYVKQAGVMKKVLLQEPAAQVQKANTTQEYQQVTEIRQAFAIYNTTGQYLGNQILILKPIK